MAISLKNKLLYVVDLHGVPQDMESVDALIHKRDERLRKEFEKADAHPTLFGNEG
jgi:hypothetical protein